MNLDKKASFSSDGEYFALANKKGSLKIWETHSNKLKHQYVLNSCVNFTCSALTWGPSDKISSGDEEDISPLNHQCLVIGTVEGAVLLYDSIVGKFCNHFVTAHTGAINDLCWYSDSLFSCSNDKFIAVWDIATGKLKTKWETEDGVPYSICVIDSDNLLSASTAITWWNVVDKTIIKKFNGHKMEILSLLSVFSTDISSNPYFLSAAVEDTKISAWHLSEKNSKSAVASFNLTSNLRSIDTTKHFSKEKPMYMSVVVEGGTLLLFKHVLNGRIRKNLVPQMTLHVVSKPTGDNAKPSAIPIISSKFSINSESCIIAYGSLENPTFEKVKIVDCPKTLTLARDKPLLCQESSTSMTSEVKIYNKLGEFVVVNGKLPVSPILESPKRKKQKDPDINSSYIETEENIDNCSKTQSPARSQSGSSQTVKKKQKKERVSTEKSTRSQMESSVSQSISLEDKLLRSLQTEDRALLNVVLQCDDVELIRSSVQTIPLDSLKFILLELQNLLSSQEKRYSSSLRKWLKEILNIHLQYIITHKTLLTNLDFIEDYIDAHKISETISKMSILRGLLNIHRIQSAYSEYSDSETEGIMES